MPNRVDLGFTVNYLPGREQHTPGEVAEHMRVPGNVIWVRAGDLLGDLYNSCVDGRENGEIVGLPGGDVSLLTEAIIALGSESGKRLNRVEIYQVFQWYLNTFGAFYMHTDEHALKSLGESLLSDERFEGQLPFNHEDLDSEQVLGYLLDPNPERQVALLDHLVIPENIGCGHLKAMLENPEMYGVSQKVIEGLMGAFFYTFWHGSQEQKDRLEYRILEGGHREGAVTQIFVGSEDAEIDNETMIPMVRPANGTLSMFVVHPQVIKWMQKSVTVALAESGLFPDVPREEIERINRRMGELSATASRLTVSLLALDLPKYTFVLQANQ